MKTQIMIALFIAGIACGWILGLWQQAAQKSHRQTCPVCMEVNHAH